MVCLDYDSTVECSVCHEATPDGYSEVDGKFICDECFNKKENKPGILKTPKPPQDSGIYVKELEETLLNCFGQWKEITAALYRYLGRDACERVKDLDCIEWFCCAIKAMLTELKRQEKYPEVFEGLLR